MLVEHRYGPDVVLLGDPFLQSLLARISAPETGIDQLPALVRSAYQRLCFEVLAREFPTMETRFMTRMAATEPRALVRTTVLCRQTRLVICAVIRAGILPSQTCYEVAGSVLPAENVRLDFVNMSRTVDEAHQVTGVRMDGSKIGGPVDGAVVLIPDPMGATGGTVAHTISVYRALGAAPKAIIAAHLIVTPEAIVRLREFAPGVKIYAGRLDRGLSPEHVLDTVPGTHVELERGLNDVQYIVPGAGGMGELLTNSWV
ncbi:MAG TPA: uracil phosphoribosyltransferase [Planctomycetota bacterium]|nr:uracil phosphoribosyltransferase [Planctomycetota bacterium]